ncbi:acetylornithine transaminase [Rhodospirillum rubrum]|uniref:aspartate aminotransferase family protein n=1 Tax=Rhodospirillum rubrum TaxID=1085 RepID=UPI001906A399|nr:aspartate aminotransferase family protein [Rhodospirillum rubrum]MBK1666075.1 acetylornithine transaminase [Rhodospirillum rubrum]MBK1678201.1 acetylornithine transaminase [Rhodospirillum rubrum]
MSTVPAVMPTYSRVDLSFDRGEGAWLLANDGRRFLDFASGIAVTGLGHAHPHLVEALTSQAAKLWHCSNLFRIPGQERLAQRLVDASFADSVFFTNSGAEAIEAALKLARRHQHVVRGETGRYRTIVTRNAFHGRTLATVTAGGQAKHVKGFEPLVEGFDRVDFGDLDAARAAVTEETAAILVEPIQGEGGIFPAPEGYLSGLRRLADEHGLLLILDEVQTGVGRTGKLFAHEWDGIIPDVVAIAKGIGAGFPMGACLAREPYASALVAGSHGSTFGGNPLAMAVGNAVLDIILAEGFLDGVSARGADLIARLDGLVHRHPTILAGVRGRGLMIGLVCAAPNGVVLNALREQGLLAVPAEAGVVRLLPPMIIGEAEVTAAEEMIDRACVHLEREAA